MRGTYASMTQWEEKMSDRILSDNPNEGKPDLISRGVCGRPFTYRELELMVSRPDINWGAVFETWERNAALFGDDETEFKWPDDTYFAIYPHDPSTIAMRQRRLDRDDMLVLIPLQDMPSVIRRLLEVSAEMAAALNATVAEVAAAAEDATQVATPGACSQHRTVANTVATVENTPPRDSRYWLRRLDRERPDLAGRVRAGELTANAASVAAGWRRHKTRSPASNTEQFGPAKSWAGDLS
jgi:hypothetical protein